ncbi:MAG: hypothetical protein IPK02_17620 [Candidatus Accumulibacter sp.]|uniref:DUF616 domain-containing protein n=1 Tax=Candidatus Accumulibacter affinis TaxID=2954384 RepID=A0A935TDZ8_9PROT|nr:hypothetical protein [Candidatus Accumulibacter affinis]
MFTAQFNYTTPNANRSVQCADCVRPYCLFSVIVGDYDDALAPAFRDETVDYVLITDRPTTDPSGWDRVIVVDTAADPIRQSRYLKMHLSEFLPVTTTYDAVGYIDGNISLTGSVVGFFHEFIRSGRPIGLVPHPERNCAYQEAAAVILRHTDSDANVRRVVAYLEDHELPDNAGLFEMGFFIFRPETSALRFFAEWWRLFEGLGNRDQLLVPCVLRQMSLDYFPLLPVPISVRAVPSIHPSFAYRNHRPKQANSSLAVDTPNDGRSTLG